MSNIFHVFVGFAAAVAITTALKFIPYLWLSYAYVEDQLLPLPQ